MIYISGSRISRFLVEVVKTPEELKKGLSGRQSLGQRRGMLFVFPTTGKQSMWMPNMHFSLDIVWIDENREIVKIEENVNPCSDMNKCISYSSYYRVKWAIELNAGDASRIGIEVGKKLEFNEV